MQKNMVIAIAAVALTVVSCGKKKLDTDTKKASYAIGQQIGSNLKQQNIEFDAEVLAQALKDASAGKSDMTKEEQQQALMKLQAKRLVKTFWKKIKQQLA